MIVLTVKVVTTIDNWAVETLRGHAATWEGTQRMDPKLLKKPIRFSCLQEHGSSEVKVAVEEKLSGPTGTYSSVSVRVEISGRCEGTEAGITATHALLYQEASKALEHYIGPAHNLLLSHLGKN